LKTLGVWAFHGGKDPVVPLGESNRMVEALKKVGTTDVKLTVYPEAGHDSWTETYNNPEFYEWLLKHRRETAGK
jgi:predicted peptidase